MNLDFLSNITLKEVATKPKATRTPKVVLPSDEVDLRVYANGKVYPSKAFAEKNNLDFSARIKVVKEDGSEELIVAGNGLDIFQSADWHMWPKEAPSMLFITVIPKAEPKVDLWGSCKYDEEGEPKSSILTQGTNTFSKNNLVKYIADTLEVVWEATEFVDLKMADVSVPSLNNSGVFYLPKTISSGARKGEPDAIRRENISIFPLVLANPSEEKAVDTSTEEIPNSNEEDFNFEDAPDSSVLDAGQESDDWANELGGTV